MGAGQLTKSTATPVWRWHLPVGGGLILLLTILAYWPAFTCGFVWDDDRYVTDNPLLHSPDGWKHIWFSKHVQSQYFPLVYSTFRLEYALWGLEPTGYHAVNILLHAGNALLVWAILRRFAVPGAWLAAALFALHPVQVETVAWITELKNTESTVLYLSAVLAWFSFLDCQTQRRWLFYALALALQVAALLAKTTACTLPAALVLMLWLRRQPVSRQRMIQILPFCVVSVAMGLVTIWWESHLGNYAVESGDKFGWLERLLIASRALWFYAGKLVWPVNLAFSYPRWHINPHATSQYVWLMGCFVVAGLLYWQRKAISREVIAAVVFFTAVLSPMLGFIWLYTFRYAFVADHYQYLACIGPLALFAGVTATLTQRWRRLPRFIASSLLLLVLGVLTWRQAGTYRDTTTLWSATVARSPGSFMARNNLGLHLKEQGKLAEAEAHYREALRLKPDYGEAWNNLGEVVGANGDLEEALDCFQRALKFRPGFAEAFNNAGGVLSEQGKHAEATDYFARALKLAPDMAEAHNNLAIVFRRQGKMQEAIESHQRAIALRPLHGGLRYTFGTTLLASGNTSAAMEQLELALQANPAHVEAHLSLARIQAAQRNYDGAIHHYLAALSASPNEPDLHFVLADLFLQNGPIGDAKAHYVAGLKLEPDHAAARFNLGMILVTEGKISEALAQWRESVRLNPAEVRALNSLAWVLATTKDSTLRDGREAVELGERAARATDYAHPAILDTLAAAYAEAGRFNEAEASARKALDLATASGAIGLADSIRIHLNEFSNGRPHRE